MPKLVQMPLMDIFKNYQPAQRGFLDWSWQDQYIFSWTEDGPRTNTIITLMEREGAHFNDEKHPITLGRDGRVFDGHIRLLAARYLSLEFVNVRVQHPFYSHYDEVEQEKETRRFRMWQHSDWHATLDMIIWEHENFHNDIPYSGDHRPTKEKVIARVEANSGYERNTQRAADIRRIVMAAKLLPKPEDDLNG